MDIFFRPHNDCLKYKVAIDTYNVNISQSANTLSFDCEIQQLNTTFKGYIVSFKRSNILLNRTNDNEPIEEILLIAGRLLEYLKLEVDEYGKILNIANLKEIHKLWANLKFKIKETYEGELVNQILEGLDRNVMDKEKFMKSLVKDTFLYHYLNNIYTRYLNSKAHVTGTIYAFADIDKIDISKIATITMDQDTEDKIITSEGLISSENITSATRKELGEKSEIKQKTEHYISSEKYLKDIYLEQEYYSESMLTNRLQMQVKLINK